MSKHGNKGLQMSSFPHLMKLEFEDLSSAVLLAHNCFSFPIEICKLRKILKKS